ncbi:hypothetical protein CEUSTIGMA_g2489.t1 [Chlamydomonas eustigma]|uniref:C-CAP/cofactor C-like domain-containing protein n=1 Tax=Chlamydomonas eustigma TaxID=1157962 RepID=A0A250WW78_9CHLO|nr:hypothetical protein CEUSTIGMA_g2489.t1 [Chlamydomonas eustigma]|eukprot:GAX75045.1 hypothetical protein CEUSTIGMA_g2489.t1 [Chlamydomonas eustigma]
MEQTVARLERVAERLEQLAAAQSQVSDASRPCSGQAQVSANPGLSANSSVHQTEIINRVASTCDVSRSWRDLVSQYLNPVLEISRGLGDEVDRASKLFGEAFKAVDGVLQASSNTQRPDSSGLQRLLQPVATHMGSLGSMAEGRRTPGFNHIKALSESVLALSFLAYTGPSCGLAPPPQHVLDSWQSAEFYATKVMTEFRSKDVAHVNWVKGLKELMIQLETFVRLNNPQGLTWSPAGGVTKESPLTPAINAATAPPASVRSGGPPPPPPGPPPPPLSLDKIQETSTKSSTAAGGGSGQLAALFKDISKGEGVTSGLKKVTEDMKTKNRPDRTSVVKMPEAAPPSTGITSGNVVRGGGGRGAGGVPTGPAKLELVDRKWTVEYQVGNRSAVIEVTDPKQSLYVYGCKDSLIQVRGKVNNIALDSCHKTGVIFTDVIASCEVINCKGVQLQTTGIVPTISVEKTDGCQVYISEKLTKDENFQVVTAKCSEMNVVVMTEGQHDVQELPIPEQFISSFQGGKLITVAASHSGA